MSGPISENWDEPEPSEPGPCYLCGRDPAAGYASIAVGRNKTLWYCHGDDEDITCYMRVSAFPPPAPYPGDDE